MVSELDARAHWEAVYATKTPETVSWFRQHLETSLDLIERAAPDHDSSIIDVGGSESTLVDDLLVDGYRDITALDISKKALEVARQRLGAAADQMNWVAADITEAGVLHQSYDV